MRGKKHWLFKLEKKYIILITIRRFHYVVQVLLKEIHRVLWDGRPSWAPCGSGITQGAAQRSEVRGYRVQLWLRLWDTVKVVSRVGEERGEEVQPGLTDLELWNRNMNMFYYCIVQGRPSRLSTQGLETHGQEVETVLAYNRCKGTYKDKLKCSSVGASLVMLRTSCHRIPGLMRTVQRPPDDVILPVEQMIQ